MKKQAIFRNLIQIAFPNFTVVTTSFQIVKYIRKYYLKYRHRNSVNVTQLNEQQQSSSPPPSPQKKKMKFKLAHKVGIGSGGMLAFIVIFWIAFPKILNSQIKKMVSIKEGNDIYDMYLKVPFPLVFKLYIFNVTNPIEVTERGAKPIVREIGPFVYDEWKEKVDIVENEADDTMEYTIKNTFVYNQQLSGSLTGDEIVTIPHPLIAGLVLVVENEKPAALTLINKALTSIYRNPQTSFLTASVNDILFQGVHILCNVTDFPGKAVCSQLKTEAKDLVEVEPNIFKFSLFGPKNGTKGQRVKVFRGNKNIKDLGHVSEFEGKPELTIWTTKECNTYQGTDSTIFPPGLTEEEGIVSFGPEICRSLKAYYVEKTKYAGIPVRRYAADLGDQSTRKEDKCYCPAPDKCLKKGLFDLTKCVGAPLYASLPHFYLSDPSLVDDVDGLTPNQRDHEIIILFEAMTGSPVSAKKRLQFNIPLHPIPKVNCMKNLPTVVLPMFWAEEGVDLNATWTDQLNNQLFRVLKITKVFKYVVLLGSLAGIGAAFYLNYQTKSVTITPVHEANSGKKKDISMIGQTDKKMNDTGHVNHAMSNEIDKY